MSTEFPNLPNAGFLHLNSRTGDVTLAVHVTPNARQTRVDGLYEATQGCALRIRLNAPPVDGKANAALIKWIAAELGIAQRHVSLHRGQSARDKQLLVEAIPARDARWERLLPADAAK
ncbi:MAG: DUF167 domain-containing protein [Pseudomonadota bacterium]